MTERGLNEESPVSVGRDDVASMPPGSGRRALIVGGTGPTGPDVVTGMLERGFDVSIFHGGKHEVDLPAETAHIHGDPHFPDTIADALDGKSFDVVIAQYGRLRHLVAYFQGRVEQIVAIGGMNSPLAAPADPRWGALGRPAVVREGGRLLLDKPDEKSSLGFKIAEAARSLFAARQPGGLKATYIAYPTLYGPRQPGCPEWWVVRRIHDGRHRLILPDGGLRLESRAYVRNVGLAPLLAVDKPDVADGKTYIVTDRDIFTTRQRVEFIARHMDADVEIVGLPYDLATPAHPFYRLGPDHRVGLGELIRHDLGYGDIHDTGAALGQTVDWLLESPDAIPEIERQLGDGFDYDFEDHLLGWWGSVRASAPRPESDEYAYSHIYRHPGHAHEDWARK